MNQLYRRIVWLSRIHRCRGFGIQSPTDYAFVRYVVNEHWPYYAYKELTDKDWLKQKLGRLYFRIANWRQPQAILEVCGSGQSYVRYFQTGCRKAHIFTGSPDMGTDELRSLLVQFRSLGADMIRVQPSSERWVGLMKQVLDAVGEQTVLLVEGIHQDRLSRQIWADIVKSEQARITFDLYYCGVVFFDKKRVKQHYFVNF